MLLPLDCLSDFLFLLYQVVDRVVDIEEILGICDRVAVLADRTFVCNVPTRDISVEKVMELSTGREV
jgi:ABC-type sugar transport system ATPase subunit